MKRLGNLMPEITAWTNLLDAARKAMLGKRRQEDAMRYCFDLEPELVALQAELSDGSYRMHSYRSFWVMDPKPRFISAATFRDRVAHHAICNVVGPTLIARQIQDSYACIPGRGVHAALDRAQGLLRQHRFCLKCDVRRYFDSVDHEVLLEILGGLFKDPILMRLLEGIVRHMPSGLPPGKGLPIGNLTSQHFANHYLGVLDHFAKDHLGCKAYLRYMDDILLLGDDKADLWETFNTIQDFLRTKLVLEFKLRATRLAPVTEGLSFLGWRLYPGLRRLQRAKWVRFTRKFKTASQKRSDAGRSSMASMLQAVSGSGTMMLRKSFFDIGTQGTGAPTG